MEKTAVADPGGDFVAGANSWVNLVLGFIGISAAIAGFRRWWKKRGEDHQRKSMSTVLAAIEEISQRQQHEHIEALALLNHAENRLASRLSMMEMAMEGFEQQFGIHVEAQREVTQQVNSRLTEAHESMTTLIRVLESQK